MGVSSYQDTTDYIETNVLILLDFLHENRVFKKIMINKVSQKITLE